MSFTKKYDDFEVIRLALAYVLIVVRDLRDRGRDIEGCIKQWFSFVKPNFQRFVEPQRQIAGMT